MPIQERDEQNFRTDFSRQSGRTREITSYYEPRLRSGLAGADLLGWENSLAQEARFSILLRSGALNGKSVLDVGCGAADLWAYLCRHRIDAVYTGVDITSEMVKYARDRFPDLDVREMDIFGTSAFSRGAFDVIFASGIFNLNLGNNLDFFLRAMDRMYVIAGDRIVFNMLHQRSTDKEDRYFYYNPDVIASILMQYPWSVQIIDNYLPNDFSVICRKNTY